jgi:drug/metabolite transporter (DMT)-like permease
MGYGVLVSGMVGHVFWYKGIEQIGVTKTLVYTYFIPVCAVLFNYFFMGEKIYLQQVIGGVLILLGVHRVLRS